MSEPGRSYPALKAPAEDGGLLVWPEPELLLSETAQNRQRLAAEPAQVQGVPLSELRRRAREWIGHASDAPLIATGHQAELHHPGVWAKNSLIHFVAQRMGGQAYHLAVDTDEPKHLHLRWPGGAEPMTDDPGLSSAVWSGLLDAPTPAHLNHLERAVRSASAEWSFRPVVPEVIASLRRLALEAPKLPAALTNALHELDWSLGLRHHSLLASPVWTSEPFLLFAHHVLSRAEQFARQYNAALDDYRGENGIRGRMRPMPDLAISNDRCEVPFWLDVLGADGRSRAAVEREGANWTLRADGDRFVLDPNAGDWRAAEDLSDWLRRHNLRLSPRAITLTMFVRLALADQFVHGIGGGQYDQITDRIFAAHFGLEPPKFSVTTATLYFPDAVGQPRACLPCVLQEGHKLRHRLLGERKMEMVRTIDALPRRSPRRREVFHQMHRELSAAALASPKLERWRQRLYEVQAQVQEDQQRFDRELFYALQPRDRLEGVIEQYREALDR